MNEIIKTVRGAKISRSNAVFIRGKYYEKEKDCYLVDNIYVRIDSDRIIFDHTDGKLHLINDINSSKRDRILGFRMNIPTFMMGIVDYNKSTNTFIVGMFTTELDKIGTVYNNSGDMKFQLSEKNPGMKSSFSSTVEGSSLIYVMNEEIIAKAGLIQTLHKEYLVPAGTKTTKFIKHTGGRYSVPKTYGASLLIKAFTNSFKKHSKDVGAKYPKSTIAEHLGKYSYGIEFETWDGRIPERYLWKAGLMPLFDGSLRHNDRVGHEYATIPFSGEIGLKAIRNSCELLSEYGLMTEQCSLHIHVGNIKRDKDTAIKLYKTLYLLQNEFYSLFPSFLKNSSQFKKQDYCSPIPNLSTFNDLVKHASDGNLTESKFKFGMPHPADRDDNHKWNIQNRYAIFNFVPLLFTDRGTVEIRISTPTSNYNKVAALLLMFIASIRYAEENDEIPSKLTLDTVMKFSLPKDICDALNPYINHRKKTLSAFEVVDGKAIYTELVKDLFNDNIVYNGKPLLY